MFFDAVPLISRAIGALAFLAVAVCAQREALEGNTNYFL